MIYKVRIMGSISHPVIHHYSFYSNRQQSVLSAMAFPFDEAAIPSMTDARGLNVRQKYSICMMHPEQPVKTHG